MKHFKKSLLVKLLIVLVSAAGLLLYLFYVDPTQGGFITILVPIAISWGILFIIVDTLLTFVRHSARRSVIRFISATISSSLLFFLLLSGIGTISVVDILLTSALVVLAAFYISRLWK